MSKLLYFDTNCLIYLTDVESEYHVSVKKYL